jgi:hypothetical protein
MSSGEQRYSRTPSLTSALGGGMWLAARPVRFTSRTRCTGGLVGLQAGLGWCGKSLPPQGFDPWTELLNRLRYRVSPDNIRMDLKKSVGTARIGLIWLRIGASSGLFSAQ